ncbi:CBO0543 family protein [Neobacillus cucumis]|uniref:CBO0543 family protein n=1 Tax=Neobacillus cucumis TaxID=1740721 RepID=UPI002853703D|nr:CBO0543 family protein [Neobacillus cucumis]MDR4947090.1 CBO0543 family protein [Neobacillus cucumis]
MKATYPSYGEIQKIENKLADMKNEYWLHHDLFTFQWWLLLIIFILPWIVWWRYVDKNRLKEIVLFGCLLMHLVGLLDDIGVTAHLWSYPYKLVQAIPRLAPIDYGILIVAHMTVYQFFGKWKSFIIVNLVMATIFTFIFEPFTVWIDIYKLDNWKYIYSLPIYVAKAVFVKWLVQRINLINKS